MRNGKSQLSASQPRVAQLLPPNRGWTMALRAPVRPGVTCPSTKNWNSTFAGVTRSASSWFLGCVFDTLAVLALADDEHAIDMTILRAKYASRVKGGSRESGAWPKSVTSGAPMFAAVRPGLIYFC
jgi:hypothetical protein